MGNGKGESRVPAKARSKRTRTGGCVWPFGSPSLTELSSSSTTSTSSSSPSTASLIYANTAQNLDLVKLPAKKHKKRPAAEAGASPAQPALRCSHCDVQKTPQWRTGLLGAKTLCNACGVRFKSGRLLPEYRPACSPTFSSEVHSNHHRKVLEMRRKKEQLGPTESDLLRFLPALLRKDVPLPLSINGVKNKKRLSKQLCCKTFGLTVKFGLRGSKII